MADSIAPDDKKKKSEEVQANGMQAAAQSAGVAPKESDPVGEKVAQMGATTISSNAQTPSSNTSFRNVFRTYDDPSQGAPLVQFGKDMAHNAGLFGTRFKNILTTGDPMGRSSVTATQPSPESVGPATTAVGNPNNLAIASRSADTPQQSAINTISSLKSYNGSLLPGESPLVPDQKMSQIAGAALAKDSLGQPAKVNSDGTYSLSQYDDKGNYLGYSTNGIKGLNAPATGVGKMNNMDSDITNQRLAADMKSKGILNPGSQAYLINDQVNSAIRENRPFGNLLSQFDKASNRASIPGADPNVTYNKDGTSFNKLTGETMTNAAAAPIESPMQKLLNTPTNTPEEAREQARQIAAERLRTTNPVQDAVAKWDADSAQRYENFKNGISNSSDPNIVASEKARWSQYSAKQAMERAYADQPNGDPLRDPQIAVNQAEAAKQMALANGATEEQIKKDPSIAGRYLRNPNGFNALGSDEKTNRLAMDHLRGVEMRDLVQQAVDRNIGGSRTAEEQNKRAIDQNSKQATIDDKAEKAEDRKAALKIAEGNVADRKITGITARLDRVDKDIEKQNTDLGDIAKKAGARKNLTELEKRRKQLQAQLEVASGLEPEVDSQSAGGNIPQPKAIPKPGDVINGYRFKGGNPNDKNNYEKV